MGVGGYKFVDNQSMTLIYFAQQLANMRSLGIELIAVEYKTTVTMKPLKWVIYFFFRSSLQ